MNNTQLLNEALIDKSLHFYANKCKQNVFAYGKLFHKKISIDSKTFRLQRE